MTQLGINASRARSGGAIAHLHGILAAVNPADFGVETIHLWSYPDMLEQLPNAPWLIKHICHHESVSIFTQIFWEYFYLPKELSKYNCDILLNVDAGSVCRFHPCVTMSRDMLSFEAGEMQRFGFSLARLRLTILRVIQISSLKYADGVIFLSKYASDVIQYSTGLLNNSKIIPHGIGFNFKQCFRSDYHDSDIRQKFKLLYISNTDWYKHQWEVVSAIELLRKRGFNLSLTLIGGGKGAPQKKLLEQIDKSDPSLEFVELIDFIPNSLLPEYLEAADIFIFASSCENLPNTLLEAMASGLPIACSNRGPMPEILGSAGVYFNPEVPISIANALEKLILNPKLRIEKASMALDLSENYSWTKCATETFTYINSIVVNS